MTSNQSNPRFPTPQPNELQSEASKASIRQRLSEEQGVETDLDDRSKDNAKPTDTVGVFEDMDQLADRHLPSVDSPPG